jgi:hypothetical protein
MINVRCGSQTVDGDRGFNQGIDAGVECIKPYLSVYKITIELLDGAP